MPQSIRLIEGLVGEQPAIQLTAFEIYLITRSIQLHEHCQMLVFGVGNDSRVWMELNKNGRTVFLEHDQQWLAKVRSRCPDIEAYPVTYNTHLREWRQLIDQPDKLRLTLPLTLTEQSWDVILVDGPSGFDVADDSQPGRMKSIYYAAQFIDGSAVVHVHDAERLVEQEYCAKYLKGENLLYELKGGGHYGQTSLRCYTRRRNWQGLPELRMRLILLFLNAASRTPAWIKSKLYRLCRLLAL